MSERSSEESDSPPIIVRGKILDSPKEIKNKKDYDRLLKVTTRKRSLSGSNSAVEELNSESSPSPSPKKKQKIKHESSDSSESEPERKYYCEHVYCDMSFDSKTSLREHSVAIDYHKEHFNKYQLFCNLCQDHIQSGLWDDTDGQNMVNSARARKADLKQLIKRLNLLHKKKQDFKKAEAEFIYRNFGADTVSDDNPRDRLPKYGSKYLKLNLPGGLKEFPLLVEEMQRQNTLRLISATDLDLEFPTDAQFLIENCGSDYTVHQLYASLQRMKDAVDKTKTEICHQWLQYNASKLEQFLTEKNYRPEAAPKTKQHVGTQAQVKPEPVQEPNKEASATPIKQVLASSPDLVQKGVAEGFKEFLKESAANPAQMFQQFLMLSQPVQPVQQQPIQTIPVPVTVPVPMPVQPLPVQVPLQQPNPVVAPPIQTQPILPLAQSPDVTSLMTQIIANLPSEVLRAVLALKESQQGTNGSLISSPPPQSSEKKET